MHNEIANFGVRDIMWTLSYIFKDTIMRYDMYIPHCQYKRLTFWQKYVLVFI